MASVDAPVVTTSGTVTVSGTATTTASISPRATDAVFVVVTARHATTPFTDTTTVSGNSLTWTKLAGIIYGNYIHTLFVGYGGSPTSGTITITFSQTPASGRYAVIYDEDYDCTSNPVQQTVTNNGTGTTGTVTFGAPTTGGKCHGFWSHAAAEATTPDSTGSTWTELHDQTTTSIALETQWLLGFDTTHTATWASNVGWAGIGVEMKAASKVNPVAFDDADEMLIIENLSTPVLLEDGGADEPHGVWAIMGGPGS